MNIAKFIRFVSWMVSLFFPRSPLNRLHISVKICTHDVDRRAVSYPILSDAPEMRPLFTSGSLATVFYVTLYFISSSHFITVDLFSYRSFCFHVLLFNFAFEVCVSINTHKFPALFSQFIEMFYFSC